MNNVTWKHFKTQKKVLFSKVEFFNPSYFLTMYPPYMGRTSHLLYIITAPRGGVINNHAQTSPKMSPFFAESSLIMQIIRVLNVVHKSSFAFSVPLSLYLLLITLSFLFLLGGCMHAYRHEGLPKGLPLMSNK